MSGIRGRSGVYVRLGRHIEALKAGHTKEVREKERLNHLGKKQTVETIKKRVETRRKNGNFRHVGEYIPSEAARKNYSIAQTRKWEDVEYQKNQVEKIRLVSEKNQKDPIWKANQSKALKAGQTVEVRKKKSLIQIEVCKRPGYKENLVLKLSGRKPTGDQRLKNSLAVQKKWDDPIWKANQLEAIFRGQNKKPNNPEKLLISLLNELLPNEYKYVGDGTIWIEGANPDFININGQKRIIEHNGDYYHSKEWTGLNKEQEEKQRVDHFKKYGYDTLIIWEHELYEDLDVLKNKILDFNRSIK